MESLEDVLVVRKCEHEIKDDLVVVHFKKEKLGFIEKTFFKKSSQKPYKIDLDEIGSFIWLLCDGNKTVGEITKLAHEHFQDKIEPVKERVELFVNQMNKNKLVSLYKKK